MRGDRGGGRERGREGEPVTLLHAIFMYLHTYMYMYVLQVAKWYVVLNGQLRLIREREGDRIFQVGDS